MSKQRKFLLISSIVGFISLFLPWVSFPIFGYMQTANGMHDGGIVVFFCFIAVGIIAYVDPDKKNFFKTKWILIQLIGIVALLFIFWYFFEIKTSIKGIFHIGVGLYVAAMAAIAVIISEYLFKYRPEYYR